MRCAIAKVPPAPAVTTAQCTILTNLVLLPLHVFSQEIDTLVAAVVRLMLYKMYEKPEVPVRRQDLVEVIQVGRTPGRGVGVLFRVHPCYCT